MEAEKDVSSPLKTVEEEKAAEVIDPLGELVKNLFDIYQRPVEVSWDGGHINQAVTFNRSYYKNTFISTTVLLRDRSSINTVSYDGRPQQNTVVVIGPFYDGSGKTTVVVCCYFYDGGVPMPVVVCCYFYDGAVDSRV
ncbi:hypothetical protein JHK86_006696 [Glycine max]|nr:hypothetical protein JHK86_006696 [Glycine max]